MARARREAKSAFTEDEIVGVMRTILGGPAPGVVLGPGDDAALVELGRHIGVLTADMLVEGVHFDRDAMSPRGARGRASRRTFDPSRASARGRPSPKRARPR